MEVSEKTLQVLKEAGWYSGRKIDVFSSIEFLRLKGFEIFEAAERFLEEFGELEIKIEYEIKRREVIKRIRYHHTNVEKTIGELRKEHFDIEEETGEKTVPVGEIYNRNLTLFISESGKLYCTTGKEGDTVWEGLDNIICEKGGKDWGEF
ncbi:MAG: SUKH-3 domain-containing protein [Tepidibacter sp.]|jgi:biotin operon repressor|uniref:SUKH-3 domain-containing protein n=1 Tax=Tepidibacter sp. TaxID=2529387 RepID=UPI0025CE4443|nr:SUKH-3 domain-containing protein [Tepidibacter sp.]MCT4509028.1 SUKH-3 domain-containing protein [Tepidibacter sp.]